MMHRRAIAMRWSRSCRRSPRPKCTLYIYIVYRREVQAMMILSLIAVFLVAVTMGLSLAHALEFPGKARLAEPTYRAVQAIYYPGFTIGGLVGEFGALIALPAMLLLTSAGSKDFWWTAAALAFLLTAHLTYWFVTHP